MDLFSCLRYCIPNIGSGEGGGGGGRVLAKQCP